MNLEITEAAADWFIEEMGLEKGEKVQFFLKIYGGIPTDHPNYFLGLSTGDQGEMVVSTEVKGITFYFIEKDKWFLEQYDMKVDMGKEEPVYHFEKL